MATSIVPHSGVYVITCLCTNKIYIGSAGNMRKRWNSHLSDLRRNVHSNIYLQRAWNKYGESSFTINTLELCDSNDLIPREQYWLDEKCSYLPAIGFNIARFAGASMRGCKMPQEQKSKISATLKGRYFSNVHRSRLSEASFNMSPETRQKLSDARKGIKLPPEYCEHISHAKSKDYIVINPEGEEMTIHNLKRFCLENNLDQSCMCGVARGIRNQHKGWRCRYPE